MTMASLIMRSKAYVCKFSYELGFSPNPILVNVESHEIILVKVTHLLTISLKDL